MNTQPMRGDRLEHELSLDLDGRLSPARRAALYETLKNDPQARALRAALVEGRDRARSTPRPRVSAAFHESLMRRVEAGEGTPEASFRQPTPWSERLRDLGIGAAAAAAVLIAVQALTSDPSGNRGGVDPRTSGQIAVTRNVDDDREADLAPRAMRIDPVGDPTNTFASAQSSGSLRPLVDRSNLFAAGSTAGITTGLVPAGADFVQPSPWVVADEAHTTFVSATEQLRRELLATDEDDDDDDVMLLRRVERLNPSAQRARAAAEWLEWMSRERFVDLPPELAGKLEAVLSVSTRLDRAMRASEQQHGLIRWELEAARERLARIQIDSLGGEMMVRCCDAQSGFSERLVERMLQSRGPMPLHLVRLPQPTEIGSLQLQHSGGQQIQIFIVRQR